MSEFPLFGVRCVFCGEEAELDVFEYWPTDRSFMLETCCEGSHQWWVEEMREWAPEEWQQFFWEKAGVEVRSVGGPLAEREKDPRYGPAYGFTVDQGIAIVPTFPKECTLEHRRAGTCPRGALTRGEIMEYVRRHHSHAASPPGGMVWGYAIYNGPPEPPAYRGRPAVQGRGAQERPVGFVRFPRTLIGVAMIGRPGARMTEKAAKAKGVRIAELTRMALDHGIPSFLRYKAASMTYQQAASDAAAMGYSSIQTFTREEEAGMSLRYARWKLIARGRGGGQVSREGRPRAERGAELAGKKVKWERRLKR